MRNRVAGSLVAAVLVFTACNGPTQPRNELHVSVAAADAGLRLANPGRVPIGYIAMDADYSPLVEWTTCGTGDAWCTIVQPGAAATLPYSAVYGYRPGATTEILVYWWPLGSDAAHGVPADSVHLARVGL